MTEVQQPAGCLEVPLVVEWAVYPGSSSFWLPSATIAAKESTGQAGYRCATPHATNSEPIKGGR